MTGVKGVVFWAVVVAAVLVVASSVVETFTADPNEGEGWIGGPIQLVLAGGPLLAVAIGLRSRRDVVARRTAVGALVLALLVAGVLVAQLLDPNETALDRVEQGVGVLVYLAVFAVEAPSLIHRRSA